MAVGRRSAGPLRGLLPILARWLHTVALSLWLGGLVAIGALVAPAAFHFVRADALLAADTIRQNALAGGIVGGSLRVFNDVCYACGVLLLLSNALLLPQVKRRWAIACFLTSALLLASAFYLGLSLTPAMNKARDFGNVLAFDRLHHQYELTSTLLQLPLLLLLALFAVLRDGSDRR